LLPFALRPVEALKRIGPCNQRESQRLEHRDNNDRCHSGTVGKTRGCDHERNANISRCRSQANRANSNHLAPNYPASSQTEQYQESELRVVGFWNQGFTHVPMSLAASQRKRLTPRERFGTGSSPPPANRGKYIESTQIEERKSSEGFKPSLA
jgi:hypothetical protein